jgi:hypothetical protein
VIRRDLMTNAEKRQRRREAGRKGAASRVARTTAQAPAPGQADDFQDLADRINGYRPPEAPPPPRLESAAEATIKLAKAEEKQLANLRAVLTTARQIRRESDLYHLAHTSRWHHSPKRWTAEQIETARRFLQGFIGPDGIPQADPIRRKGKWRL